MLRMELLDQFHVGEREPFLSRKLDEVVAEGVGRSFWIGLDFLIKDLMGEPGRASWKNLRGLMPNFEREN